MTFRNQALGILLLSLAVSTLACQSDDSDLQAEFVPATRTPGSSQVFLSREGTEDDRVAIAIRVRNTSSIGSADIVLTYDSSRVAFGSHAAGALLEQGGATVAYDVTETTPGQLRVHVIRTSGGTVSVGADDPKLVELGFRVLQAASATGTFASSSKLYDATPTALPGLTWYGGTFLGS